jgi:predicted component of type VI protein secretion system
MIDRALTLGLAPCDKCPARARCAVEHKACEAFAQFVAGAAAPRWRLAPMIPERRIYKALFAAGTLIERPAPSDPVGTTEAAVALGLPESEFWRRVAAGLPVVRCGRRGRGVAGTTLVDLEAARAWLAPPRLRAG